MKVIAAAKHHTVVATEGGEVFTWGSNRGNNGEIWGFMPVNTICMYKGFGFDWCLGYPRSWRRFCV